MQKASQRKKRGKPWRKPRAAREVPEGRPEVKWDALPRLPAPSPRGHSHFLFRGMTAPALGRVRAYMAEWPQGYPPDSIARLWFLNGVRKDIPPP